jgi:rfaE bifunctional protein kinase chain/domain
MQDIKVLLIGDFMVDQYIFCSSTRMSPEAPVPVLKPYDEFIVPGGAGNVALNMSKLGAKVSCLGYIGSDSQGSELKKILNNERINTEHLCQNGDLTTIKRRYYNNDKQVLRIDYENVLEDWCPDISNINFDEYDVVILSDYNKGVLNNTWFSKIKNENIFVDPKKDDYSFYSNATIITPNLDELEKASKLIIDNNDTLVKVCQSIIEKTNLEYIIAKKGENGMTIVGKNGFISHIDGHQVNNPDVTGAGDTVIAALSLSYFKTKNIEKSAIIANAAAAIVVGKKGTSFATMEDINNLLKGDKIE